MTINSLLSSYQELLDTTDVEKISWKMGKQARNLAKKIRTNGKITIDSNFSTLKSRVTSLQNLVASYHPTLCRIIWCIITLSFTYFKVCRVKEQISKIVFEDEIDQTHKPDGLTIDKPDQATFVDDPSLDIPDAKQTILEDNWGIVGLKPDRKKELFQRKITILTKALQLIHEDNTTQKDETIQKVRKIFNEKLQKLKRGEYSPLGLWCHATKPHSLDSILNGACLYKGGTGVYGNGVYIASVPESKKYLDLPPSSFQEDPSGGYDYGPYIFALDDLAFEYEKLNGSYISFNCWGSLWAVIGNPHEVKDGIDFVRVNSETALLAVPEDEVDKVQKIVQKNASGRGYLEERAKKIQVISLETLKAMRYFYMQAEKSVGVYMPAILVRHENSKKGSDPCHFSAMIS